MPEAKDAALYSVRSGTVLSCMVSYRILVLSSTRLYRVRPAFWTRSGRFGRPLFEGMGWDAQVD